MRALALRANKQTAAAIDCTMVAMERHLWINLADTLDVLASPSQLFSTSVEVVVDRFREARMWSAAFKIFIPRRSRSMPQISAGPGLYGSAGHRQA